LNFAKAAVVRLMDALSGQQLGHALPLCGLS
jgi:hypothetical protein